MHLFYFDLTLCYTYMTTKLISAKGLTGYLIYCGDGQFRIRIYDQQNYAIERVATFKDYDIKHSDLFFEISDDDAYLYENGDKCWIDHGPDTLGIKE